MIIIFVGFFSSLSFSGMKTPLSPSQLLESGQIFAFGGMCQELVETPTPTSISLSAQQTPSPGNWCVPAPVSCNPSSSFVDFAYSLTHSCLFSQVRVEPTHCVRCATCSWRPLLRPSYTTMVGLTFGEWDSSRQERQDNRQQVGWSKDTRKKTIKNILELIYHWWFCVHKLITCVNCSDGSDCSRTAETEFWVE